MAMTCRGILALPYANRLRLVAGASGGGNEIRWVHILEEPKYTAWLKGGELILLSGVVTGDREGALLSLLQDLFDREVAGVVLNLSTFLPAIPPSVLALGERLGLPLFEMPAEVRMVDVSQSIAFAIFQQRQKTGQVEGALRDLLTGKRLSEKRLQRLAEVGLGGGRTFRAVLFRPGLPGTPLPATPFYEEETEEAWLAQGAAYLRQVLDRLGDPGYLTVAGETILWLAGDPPGRPAALPQRLEAVTAALPQSAYFPDLQVGVGAAFRDLRTCRASADQARQALAHPQRRGGPVTWYDDLVDRRLFQRGGTREELAAMAERLLGPLLQPEHQALLDTLICYLDHNGNAKATAQAMFLHPNTLHYRLRKIQSLLHRDLGQSEDFFQVMLGRKLYDFITKN